jgi:DnaK suppressor protein
MARKDTIEKLRKVLIMRREALARAIKGDISLLSELHGETTGDILDVAADTVQDEINSRLLEVESDELVAIDAAIVRISDGTYGTCQDCGKAIPLRRLQAVPYVVDCIDCRRAAEKRSEIGPSGWNDSIGHYGYSAY